jgi:hypothetical protein
MIRVAGRLRPLDFAPLTPEDLNKLAAHLEVSRRASNTSNEDELRFLAKERDIGGISVTVGQPWETPSFEVRPVFGGSRDKWGGISDSEYQLWRAKAMMDEFVEGIKDDSPPFSRLLGRAIALGSILRKMNRPDLARAAHALEARIRSQLRGRSAWESTRRLETVKVAMQLGKLLDRCSADDAAFAARVLILFKSDIEALEEVEPDPPKTPGWKVAENRWNALVQDFGQPQRFSSLSLGERTRAIAEHRAVWITVSRDGFGGGSVWLTLMEADQNDEFDRGIAGFGVAFPAPCRLDASLLRELNRNAWEPGEMPPL